MKADKKVQSEQYLPVCPKCGSLNLKNYYLMSPVEMARPGAKKLKERFPAHPISSIVLGWQPQNPDVFVCLDCDYSGICPEIEIEDIKKFKKSLKS